MLHGFQWDLARQVERLDWLLAQLPRYADWGYNELYLHLEDAVEYPSLPGVARRDAYRYHDLERLVRAADRVGIKTVPIVNLLGHTQYLIKVREWRDLNELRAPDGSPLETGQICPTHPRTPELTGRLLRDMAPFCTAGKVHVGLDESFHLGKHPLSRREIADIGMAAHFARYVGRLRETTGELGLRLGMWADMLYFLPGAIPLLPRDIATYEWYYYAFRRRPRVELFNFRESNVGDRLRARGIEYWGCPMNGAFRYEPLPHFSDRLENILSWWRRCQRLNAAGMLITSWEPFRLAIELTTVVDAAAASLWLDGIDDPRAMLERGFARVFGKKVRGRPLGGRGFQAAGATATKTYVNTYAPAQRKRARAAARAALACDRYPFSGYPRWQINVRWDVVSRRESIAPYRREQKWFARLRRVPALPDPLAASIALRWYLAVRDVVVREALRGSLPTRSFDRALRVGEKAARAMWIRSRDPRTRSPNEQILHGDAERLAGLWRGHPVEGWSWHLSYCVAAIEPAVQVVGIEVQRPDGSWDQLQSCHTIEFQATAARRKSRFVRQHGAAINWDGHEPVPFIRIFVRGVGRVRISDVVVSDGSEVFRVPGAKVMGRKAPRHGFPRIDWNENTDVWRVRWARSASTGHKQR